MSVEPTTPKPAMQASGVFFLPKAREVYTSQTADGRFLLIAHAYQRNPNGRLEFYALRWAGADAASWYQQHGDELRPGTPLQAHWHRQRTAVEGHRVRIVATCSSIAIAQRGGDDDQYLRASVEETRAGNRT